MALTRASFSHLLSPGLKKAFYSGQMFFIAESPLGIADWIEEEEKLATIYPDTHKIPIWRLRPERVEHPIEAWRHWKLRHTWGHDWRLGSVAVGFDWDGPVVRADMTPVDPKNWDKHKKGTPEYFQSVAHSYSTAGLHAWKTREQAIQSAWDYTSEVFGRLDLYGRVAQFTLGYRAEIAMIKELFLLSAQNSSRSTKQEKVIIKDLEQLYGCEVTLV